MASSICLLAAVISSAHFLRDASQVDLACLFELASFVSCYYSLLIILAFSLIVVSILMTLVLASFFTLQASEVALAALSLAVLHAAACLGSYTSIFSVLGLVIGAGAGEGKGSSCFLLQQSPSWFLTRLTMSSVWLGSVTLSASFFALQISLTSLIVLSMSD